MSVGSGLNRDGDWIVWTAVAITAGLAMSILVSLANPVVARSIWPILLPAFILAYSYLATCHFVKRMKEWSERYLDVLLGPQKSRNEKEAQEIQAMVEHVGVMEKKVDRIEAMLTTDGDRGPVINVQDGTSASTPLPEGTYESHRRSLRNGSL